MLGHVNGIPGSRQGQKLAVLYHILVTHCKKLVHMDYPTKESVRGDKDVNNQVITDHFTHYSQVIVTSSWKAKLTALDLWEMFIIHYAHLESIITDLGRNFENEFVQELCKLGQVQNLWHHSLLPPHQSLV